MRDLFKSHARPLGVKKTGSDYRLGVVFIKKTKEEKSFFFKKVKKNETKQKNQNKTKNSVMFFFSPALMGVSEEDSLSPTPS